jgi:hypothetical protein
MPLHSKLLVAAACAVCASAAKLASLLCTRTKHKNKL